MVLDTGKSDFRSQLWLQFSIWFIMALYYKRRQILLHNATTILLQVQVSYYKMHQMVVLQNATVLLQNVIVLTKYAGTYAQCNIYFIIIHSVWCHSCYEQFFFLQKSLWPFQFYNTLTAQILSAKVL